ncbi:MAG TPA: hypothetical protein VFK68_03965 [Propionibacteriaceae bacterium]|nr:hypothetical protein [Propionibacteriaceae bacterium]
MPRRVFTDLDLNDDVPPRAQPSIGEWGPIRVPSTRSKKWARIWVSLACVVATAALFGLGYWVFTKLNGS